MWALKKGDYWGEFRLFPKVRHVDEQLPRAFPAGPVLCAALKTFLQKSPIHLAPNPQANVNLGKINWKCWQETCRVGVGWGGAGMK